MAIAKLCFMRTLLCVLLLVGASPSLADAKEAVQIKLPAAKTTGTVSLEAALASRRSNRRLAPEALPIASVGQLLWAAQGVTSKKGFRTAPSAGARYPLRVYVVLPTGLWFYQARGHTLVRRSPKDLRKPLWENVFARPWLVDAPLMILIAVDYRRTEAKYGKKAARFVHIEVGHAGQNILLQATAMGLHGVGIGAFHPVRVKETLGLPAPQELLYVLALGNPPE